MESRETLQHGCWWERKEKKRLITECSGEIIPERSPEGMRGLDAHLLQGRHGGESWSGLESTVFIILSVYGIELLLS